MQRFRIQKFKIGRQYYENLIENSDIDIRNSKIEQNDYLLYQDWQF